MTTTRPTPDPDPTPARPPAWVGHVITDPAVRPMAVPADTGWAYASAAFTDYARSLCDRQNLSVRVVPGAGRGHRAAWLPAHATIEIDTALLGAVQPPTVFPDRAEDGYRYEPAIGALLHGCAHATHTRWTAPPDTDPGIVEAALLLEETRVEATHLRRHPGDRRRLRAAATATLPLDIGGTSRRMPASVFHAARTAALIAGRAEAGVLSPGECAFALTAVDAVLGVETRERLQRIWREAQWVADTDTQAMLRLGRQWAQIAGPHPDPDCDSESESVLAVAVERTVATLAAREWMSPPASGTLARAAGLDADEVYESGLDALDVVYGPDAPTITRPTRPPHRSERNAAAILAYALRAAYRRTPSERDRHGVAGHSETSTGLLAGPGPGVPAKVAIACDVSESMSGSARAMASAAWILAHATEAAGLWTATSTVTFAETVHALDLGRDAVPEVPELDCGGAEGHQLTEALDALDARLSLSWAVADRLLVVISDGRYSATERARAQDRLDRLRAAGCAVLWLTPDHPDREPLANTHIHPLRDPATDIRAIAHALDKAIRTA